MDWRDDNVLLHGLNGTDWTIMTHLPGRRRRDRRPPLDGAIQASGLILMGEPGFRAERARIAAVVTRNRRMAAACTQAGIAVYRRRRYLLRDYPPEDLS
jgi:hypothetical protein